MVIHFWTTAISTIKSSRDVSVGKKKKKLMMDSGFKQI